VDVWSLGVVLYICLCGFPPFSDELYTSENPYTLSQQIKMGRFDYPSPYWDSVGDPALDLIDRMLTIDPEKRATVEECLEHPWIAQKGWHPNTSMDSTDGLIGAMGELDFSKRKPVRERTLLSNLNSVMVSRVIPDTPIKVWEKNNDVDTGNRQGNVDSKKPTLPPGKEEAPDAHRNTREFMEMGGKGDQPLFGDDGKSRYATDGSSVVEKSGVDPAD
jgi:serine/threonine-protein kinase CHEK2